MYIMFLIRLLTMKQAFMNTPCQVVVLIHITTPHIPSEVVMYAQFRVVASETILDIQGAVVTQTHGIQSKNSLPEQFTRYLPLGLSER